MPLSRRAFMQSGLSVGVGAWLFPPARVWAMPEGPVLRVAHLTDFHWGYRGEWNRSVDATLKRALHEVKQLSPPAQLAVVTGDLVQATENGQERQERLRTVKQYLDNLGVPWWAIPGEHDTFGDRGETFQKVIGPLHFYQEFHGVHLVGLDNVSRGYFLGRAQVRWLIQVLQKIDAQAPLIVLSHAPLSNVFEPWNWYTLDGQDVYRQLSSRKRVLYLFGHVHQGMTLEQGGHANWAGLPTAWPLPEPGPLIKLSPWPQGASHPDMGLGFRLIDVGPQGHMKGSTIALEEQRR